MTVSAKAFVHIRNAALGMIVAVVASSLYSAVVLALFGAVPSRPYVAANAYFVRITLWFVLPVGAVLGLHLPEAIATLSSKMAMRKGFRWGAVYGFVCGVLWAAQLSISIHAIEMLPWWVFLFGVTMGVYCACWVSLAALKYAGKKASLSRIPS